LTPRDKLQYDLGIDIGLFVMFWFMTVRGMVGLVDEHRAIGRGYALKVGLARNFRR